MTLYVGIAYALFFLALGARRPMWALVGIFALSPLHFDLGDGTIKYSIAEVNLVLALPLLALRLRAARRGVTLGPVTLPIIAYLLVCGLSSLVEWQGSDAIISWVQMFSYMIVTVLIFSHLCDADDLRRVPAYLVAVCVPWSLLGIAVNFQFMALAKNAFGAGLAIGFLAAYDLWIATGYTKRPLSKDLPRLALLGAMFIIFTGLLLTLSRGSWLGTIGGLFTIGLLRGSLKPLLKLSAVLVPIIAIVWISLPQNLKDYTTGFDTEKNRNIEIRVETLRMTQQMFKDSPVFGAGLGLRKNIDATNIVWLTLSETGILGFLSFSWIFWVFYRWAWRARHILPPSDPRYTLLSLGAALMTYKLFHGMVDHYWTRGAITPAWAGVGMILCYCRIPLEAGYRNARQRIAAPRARAMAATRHPVAARFAAERSARS